jgi:hypothetical protein
LPPPEQYDGYPSMDWRRRNRLARAVARNPNAVRLLKKWTNGAREWCKQRSLSMAGMDVS